MATKRTKRQKARDKEDIENAVLGIAAAASPALAFPGETTAQFKRTRYQHQWMRPSGQITQLKGFSPKEIRELEPGMQAMSDSLRSSVKTQPKVLWRSGFETTLPGFNSAYGFNTARNNTFINASAFKNKDVNPAAVLVHETGHSIDRANKFGLPGRSISAIGQEADVKKSLSTNIAKKRLRSFGWRVNKASDHVGTNRERANRAIGAYQSSDPFEDFAETFRHVHGMNITKKSQTPGVGPKKVGWDKDLSIRDFFLLQDEEAKVSDIQIAKNTRRKYGFLPSHAQNEFASHVTPQSVSFMRQHVIHPSGPLKTNLNIKRVYLTNRNIAIAGGSAIAIGGGVYAWRHRDEIHRKIGKFQDKHPMFKSSVNNHSTGWGTSSTYYTRRVKGKTQRVKNPNRGKIKRETSGW